MATWTRFEDIEAWQKGRKLTAEIYRLTNLGTWAKDFAFVRQIREAAISITSNIAEGFERDGTREFCNFVSIAKGSTGELCSQLYAALDVGHLSESDFQRVYPMATEVGRMLGGLMRYLRDTELRGHKFGSNS